MGKKIITILRSKIVLNWTYDKGMQLIGYDFLTNLHQGAWFDRTLNLKWDGSDYGAKTKVRVTSLRQGWILSFFNGSRVLFPR